MVLVLLSTLVERFSVSVYAGLFFTRRGGGLKSRSLKMWGKKSFFFNRVNQANTMNTLFDQRSHQHQEVGVFLMVQTHRHTDTHRHCNSMTALAQVSISTKETKIKDQDLDKIYILFSYTFHQLFRPDKVCLIVPGVRCVSEALHYLRLCSRTRLLHFTFSTLPTQF